MKNKLLVRKVIVVAAFVVTLAWSAAQADPDGDCGGGVSCPSGALQRVHGA